MLSFIIILLILDFFGGIVMKKFTKILVALTSLCLLVGALVLVVSANTEPDAIDGTYVVDGTGYDRWADAVEAAGGEKTIYLNEDVEIGPERRTFVDTYKASSTANGASIASGVDVAFDISKDVILDMNGHTITQTFDGVLFYVSTKATLTVTGGGVFNDVRTFAVIDSRCNINIDATDGIEINTAAGSYTVFVSNQGASNLTFSGDIDLTPMDAGTTIFRVLNTADKKGTEDINDDTFTPTNIVFDTVHFYVDLPKSRSAAKPALGMFIYTSNGVNIEIKNASYIRMEFCTLFEVYKSSYYKVTDLTGYLDKMPVLIDENNKPEYTAVPDSWWCNIKASDSTIISGDKSDRSLHPELYPGAKDQDYFDAQSNSQGTLISFGLLALNADFDNCTLQGGGRVFNSSTGYTADKYDGANSALKEGFYQYEVDTHQLRFTDCTFTRNENFNKDNYLFVYGVNAIWEGGSISGSNSTNNRLVGNSWPYGEYSDGEHYWGILLREVSLSKTTADVVAYPGMEGHKPENNAYGHKNSWKAYWSYEGVRYENYSYFFGGEIKSHPVYITEKGPSEVESYIKASLTGSTMVVDYVKGSSSGNVTGKNDWASIVGVGDKAEGFGAREVSDGLGGGYLQLDFYANKTVPTTDIFDSNAYTPLKTRVLVYEFDIASAQKDKWLAGDSFDLNSQWRFSKNYFNKDGTFLGYSGLSYINGIAISIQPDGTFQTKHGGNLIAGAPEITLPAGGVYTKITIVSEFSYEEAGTMKIYAYEGYDSTNKVGTGEKTLVEVPAYIPSVTQHLYVNGQWMGSVDVYTSASMGGHTLDESNGALTDKKYATYEELANVYNDGMRMTGIAPSADSSIIFDNLRVFDFKTSDYDEKFSLDGFDDYLYGALTPIKSLEGHSVLNKPSERSIAYVGSVDGVKYEKEEDLTAAIKEGSIVELDKNGTLTEILNVNKSFILKLNDASFPGFFSDTHKASIYSTLGWFKFSPAGEGDLYDVVLKSDEYGVDETIKAALGSTIKVGADAIPDIEIPKEDGFYKIFGWHSANDDSVLDKTDISADGKIYFVPVYSIRNYLYTLSAEGGETLYFFNEADVRDFAKNVAEFVSANSGKRIFAVLWTDIDENSESPIELGSVSFCLDLNGNSFCVGGEEKGGAFAVSSYADVAIYSSKPKAFLSLGDSALLDVSCQGGILNVWIGGFSDTGLGISADGANIEVSASSLIKYTNTADDAPCANINIDGGLYSVRGEASSFLEIVSDANVTVNGMKYAGSVPLVSVQGGAVATVDITNSFIASIDNSGELSKASVIGELSKGSAVSITGTMVSGGIAPSGEGSVVLGEDCTLSYLDEVKGNTGVTVAANAVYAYSDSEVEVEGIRFPVTGLVDKAEDLAKVIWYDSNGDVIGVTYNSTNSLIIDGEDYASCVSPLVDNEWYQITFTEWDIPATFTAGETVEVYPICENDSANVKGFKANITAYTYFRINYFVPDTNETGIENFRLLGIFEDEEGTKPLASENVKMDGKNYIMYNEWPGASDASVNLRFLIFTVGSKRYVEKFQFGIPMYAEQIMNDPERTEEEKRLVINAVRYANESYKLASKNSEGFARYNALLLANKELLVNESDILASEQFANAKDVNTSSLADYMQGASFVFGGSEPRFVFLYKDNPAIKLPESANGYLGAWPKHNLGIFTHLYWETSDGMSSHDLLAYHVGFKGNKNVTEDAVKAENWSAADKVYAMTTDLYISDVTQTITLAIYTEDGTVVHGTYSLAAYIASLGEQNNTEFYNAAMALYAFSLAAQEYGSSDILA